MIVQRDVAPTALGAHLTWRDDICVADSFEYPNRYDWRYNHDIQGEPETIPLDAIAWKYLLDRCGTKAAIRRITQKLQYVPFLQRLTL